MANPDVVGTGIGVGTGGKAVIRDFVKRKLQLRPLPRRDDLTGFLRQTFPVWEDTKAVSWFSFRSE